MPPSVQLESGKTLSEQEIYQLRAKRELRFKELTSSINQSILDFFQTNYQRELVSGENAIDEFAKILPTLAVDTPELIDANNILVEMERALGILLDQSTSFFMKMSSGTVIEVYKCGLYSTHT